MPRIIPGIEIGIAMEIDISEIAIEAAEHGDRL